MTLVNGAKSTLPSARIRVLRTMRAAAAVAAESAKMPMRRTRLAACALLLASTALGAGCQPAATGEARAEQLYTYCAHCHGESGEGNPEWEVPSIAGLPEWYVDAQLEKFRIGARGDHPEDLNGLRMRPMARTLATREEVELVAEHVAKLPAVRQPATVEGGDAERGRQLFTPCITCHGERAEGKQDMNAPPLTVLDDWYMVAQLEKFREGIRGTDPLDATGGQMRPMSLSLTDEQAVRDVVAYIRSLDQGQQE